MKRIISLALAALLIVSTCIIPITAYVEDYVTITEQPKSMEVAEGEKATFRVTASNASAYKWYYQKPGESKWNAVTKNGESATYTLTTAARHNGYSYRCKVSNSLGSVYSDIVWLTVTASNTTAAPATKASSKPTITTQPKSVTVTEGAKATFKVVAKNADSYKW